MKIFCIGFQKTGTTSLGLALEKLGYKVCGVRYDLLPFLKKGDHSLLMEIIGQYDAFKDNPWPVLYKIADLHYPGSKFILTVREENAWLRSLINHFNSTPSAMQDFIYGRPYPLGNEPIYLDTYRKHNREVIAYFSGRDNDLLTIDLTNEKGWERICAFLGVPVPEIPFPHENKGMYTVPGKLLKYIRKKYRRLLKKLKIIES